ncbi:MAG TPA: hypothetical protein VJ063_18155 [Verrucomicrobiae bacterium]|nr:hypothetical protein [Verrucomicrobiae bacterium]
MKREILLLVSAAALALAGCATHHENVGGTSAETGAVYGNDQDTSDFGRGEVWRNTPNAQRERGHMQGPINTVPESVPDNHAPGDYHP